MTRALHEKQITWSLEHTVVMHGKPEIMVQRFRKRWSITLTKGWI